MTTFPKISGSFVQLSLISLFAVFIPLVVLAGPASAASVLSDSDVYSILCDGLSEPDIQVAAPLSDSVVNTPSVMLSGTTTRTTQIEIYVNNVYSESLSVNPDGPFNTTVSLQEGTNTIRLEAYFSCNHTTADFSVVVNYEPEVEPSPGAGTDTNVPGGGIVIPPTISNPNAPNIPAEEMEEPSFPERIGEKLTFGGAPGEAETVYEAVIEPLAGWTAVALLVVSLIVVASPVLALAIATKLFGAAAAHVHLNPKNKLFMRFFGALVAGSLLFLLQL